MYVVCCGIWCRFDLIFLMLDPQDEQFDRRLATHLVSLYHQTEQEEETHHMVISRYEWVWFVVVMGVVSIQDMATLRDYIAFARTYLHPSLSDEAGQALVQAYIGT